MEVNDLLKNVFYSRLVIDIDGREVKVGARPSDAIAVAVHEGVPIFVAVHVLVDASSGPF